MVDCDYYAVCAVGVDGWTAIAQNPNLVLALDQAREIEKRLTSPTKSPHGPRAMVWGRREISKEFEVEETRTIYIVTDKADIQIPIYNAVLFRIIMLPHAGRLSSVL